MGTATLQGRKSAHERLGSSLWARGFRPFFLASAVWAIIAIAVWAPVSSGDIQLHTAFSPVDWHSHEMIFGYVAAVAAGFLLTAVPNWTGRLPVSGWRLVALLTIWITGRLAVCESARIDRIAAALVDCAFLFVFAALVAKEVLAGKNWRNAKVVGLVVALGLADVAFHYEGAATGDAAYAQRAALGLIVMLILLIGGRVTPSFTHNWLARADALTGQDNCR